MRFTMSQITPDSVIQRMDDVDCGTIEDEGIILNLNNGDYFRMNGVSLFIWKALNGRNDLKKIAEKVASHFNVNEGTVLTDLLAFARKLDKLKLTQSIA